MKSIYPRLVFSLFVLLFFTSLNAQTIVSGIKTTTPFITTATNVIAATSHGKTIVQGPTVTRGSMTFGTTAGTRGGFAIDGVNATFDTAQAKGNWVEFAVSPATGYDLNITGITLKGNGTVASTAAYYAVAFAIDDTTMFAKGTSVFLDSAGVAGNILYRTNGYLASGADTTGQKVTVNNGSTIYVRIYMWNASARAITSAFTVTNFVISGTVTATQATTSTTNASICFGDSLLFNKQYYSTSGTYTTHLINSAGADSAAKLILTVAKAPTTTTASLVGCKNIIYKGITYNSPTVITDTIKSVNNCDSIYHVVTISINCSPGITSFAPTTGAIGDTITIKGFNLTSTTSVSFGGTSATWFLVQNDTTLIAIVGNGTSGSISITNTNGTATFTGFTFNSANIIKGIQTASPFITAGTNVVATISHGAGILQLPAVTRGSITFGTRSATRAGFAADGVGATVDTAIAKNEYVQFAVSPKLGYNMNISGITIKGNGTGAFSTTNNYAIAFAIGDSSLFTNGGAIYIDSSGAAGDTLYSTNGYLVTGDDTANQNIAIKDGEVAYLRVYLWGASARTTTSQFTITNFTVAGSLTKDSSSTTITDTICNGTSFTLNGVSYSTSGVYVAHLINSLGGDSTVILKLKVTSPAKSDTLSYSNCTKIIYKGNTYTTSKVFIDTVKSNFGCDSIYHTVNITISCVPSISSFYPTSAAIGDTVTIIGANLTGSSAVSFGTIPASSFTVITDTSIQAIVGAGATGIVSVTTPNGIVTANGFVYNTANIITGIKTTTPFITAGKNVGAAITWGSGILQVPAVARGSMTFGTATRSFAADGANATIDTAIAKKHYVQFAVSPVSGYKMNINGITLKGNGTLASTTDYYAVAYTIGDSTLFNTGGATFLDSAGNTGNLVNRTSGYLVSGTDTTGLSVVVNNNSSIYIRVYLWNAAAAVSRSQFTITNFTVYGSVISAATSSTTDTSICRGTSFTFNGVTYDTAGSYVAHFTNSVGADSAAHLNLSIKDTSASITHDTIANGSSVTFNGTVYTKAGTYVAHLTNAAGCDSLATLIVTVKSSLTFSGTIIHPTGKVIPSVTLSLNDTGSILCNNGSYSFNPSFGSKYTVKPSKNNDVNKANGVTVLDALLVQAHILGKSLLNSPYKIIAADVDNSGSITVLDIIYMKRLILGIDTTFKGNKLWAFIDSSYHFADTTKPFPYKDSISVTNITTNQTAKSFIGVKLGDVNWDWISTTAGISTTINKPIELYYNNINTDNKTEVRVPVRVKNFKDILGMQYTLGYNKEVLELKSIENNQLDIEYGTSHTNDGKVSFIWTEPNLVSKTLNDGDVLMELVFNKKGTIVNEEITLSNDITPVEAWKANYTKVGIVKTEGRIAGTTVYALNSDNWNVSPNPSNGTVKTTLSLMQSKELQFQLTTLEGKVIMNKKVTAIKGNSTNILNLQQQNKLAAGVYYLKAVGIEGENTKRIVIE